MNTHMLAYAAAALDASAGDVQLNAVSDQVFTIANNNFQMRENMQIVGAYAGGVTATRFRFQVASLRNTGFPQIWPFALVIQPVDNPQFMDLSEKPLLIPKLEELRCDVTNTAANNANVIAILRNSPVNKNINTPNLRWVRFTAAVVGIANGWSPPIAASFQENLAAGSYSVYGMAVSGTAINAARINFPDQLYRPGCLGLATMGLRSHPLFEGNLGLWGRFNTYSLPSIEAFTSAAGAVTVVGNMLIGRD